MPAQNPHIFYEPHHPITNFHGNINFTPRRYYDVWNMWDDSTSPLAKRWLPGLLALQQIIRDAEKAGLPIRAFGANWSLSNAVVTPGSLLNTKPLNVIEPGVHPEHCDPQFLSTEPNLGLPSPAERLVFAQCGASLAELNAHLENHGLALPTSGAANGQTVAGAISTGTHGAAWNFGAIHDSIVGLHLITQAGQSYWIEPASKPVMSQSFCDLLQAQLIRDDRLFNAVLVSFGSFGIIHAVIIKAEPLYLLEHHLVPRPYDDVLSAIADIEHNVTKLLLTDFKGKIPKNPPYHFEVVLNPFAFDITPSSISPKKGHPATYVRYMYKHSPNLEKHSPTHELLGPVPQSITTTTSTDAFGLLEQLGKLAPLYSSTGLEAGISQSIIQDILQPDSPTNPGTVLTPGGTFNATALAGRGLSCELFFPRESVPKAIEIIVREFHTHPFPCLPSLRFVGVSNALLAPNCYAPYTCAIEFPAPQSTQTISCYHSIWNALKDNNIPHTFHWGQCLEWGPTPADARSRLQSVYGNRLTDWLAARKQFLNPVARKTTFSNPLLASCGLTE